MKVAIYSRVSTLDKGQSTETQTNSLKGYCERMGWTFSIFEDYASGKDLKRPKFQAMAEMLRKREFDILLVSKIDRLSRSVLDFCQFTLQLDSWGIRLLVLDQGLDTDKSNPMSRLLIMILAAFAEFEREMIRDRTRRGMANAKAKGIYIGGKKVEGLDKLTEQLCIWSKKHSPREISKMLWEERKMKVSHMTIFRRLVKAGVISPKPQNSRIGEKVYANLPLH